jgi:hypothetical protein
MCAATASDAGIVCFCPHDALGFNAFRATAEFAWINVNVTRIETGSFEPVEGPAKHYWGAQTQRSLVHFAIGSQTMPLAIAGSFRAQRL